MARERVHAGRACRTCAAPTPSERPPATARHCSRRDPPQRREPGRREDRDRDVHRVVIARVADEQHAEDQHVERHDAEHRPEPRVARPPPQPRRRQRDARSAPKNVKLERRISRSAPSVPEPRLVALHPRHAGLVAAEQPVQRFGTSRSSSTGWSSAHSRASREPSRFDSSSMLLARQPGELRLELCPSRSGSAPPSRLGIVALVRHAAGARRADDQLVHRDRVAHRPRRDDDRGADGERRQRQRALAAPYRHSTISARIPPYARNSPRT